MKQSFPPKLMIVDAMCQSRTFPLIKVPGRVTVDANYYVNYVLDPLVRNHLVPHFGQNVKKLPFIMTKQHLIQQITLLITLKQLVKSLEFHI